MFANILTYKELPMHVLGCLSVLHSLSCSYLCHFCQGLAMRPQHAGVISSPLYRMQSAASTGIG